MSHTRSKQNCHHMLSPYKPTTRDTKLILLSAPRMSAMVFSADQPSFVINSVNFRSSNRERCCYLREPSTDDGISDNACPSAQTARCPARHNVGIGHLAFCHPTQTSASNLGIKRRPATNREVAIRFTLASAEDESGNADVANSSAE